MTPHRRQSCGQRQGADANPVGVHERFATDIKCICAALERVEGGRDVFRSLDFDCNSPNTKCTGRSRNLARVQHGVASADIGHDRQSAESGDNLAQKVKSFGTKIGCLAWRSGSVAARSCQTGDETGADRVSRRHEDNRRDRCGLLCRDNCGVSDRHNDIDLEPDELGCDLSVALFACLRPAIVEGNGAALNPAEFVQPLHKSGEPLALGRRCGGAKEPDGRQLAWLLRARRQRPCGTRAAERG
jgi:hypothetical protein